MGWARGCGCLLYAYHSLGFMDFSIEWVRSCDPRRDYKKLVRIQYSNLDHMSTEVICGMWKQLQNPSLGALQIIVKDLTV